MCISVDNKEHIQSARTDLERSAKLDSTDHGNRHKRYNRKRRQPTSIHGTRPLVRPHFVFHSTIARSRHDNDNDNDNDTLREVRHPSMKAWPYRPECRGHDPAKKESVALMKLALLARCAQTHC